MESDEEDDSFAVIKRQEAMILKKLEI